MSNTILSILIYSPKQVFECNIDKLDLESCYKLHCRGNGVTYSVQLLSPHASLLWYTHSKL